MGFSAKTWAIRQMRLTALDSSRRHLTIVIAAIVAAFVLGGGGSPSPSTELVLQLFVGLAALAWLWLLDPLRVPAGPWPWLLAAVITIVPLLQLIPLPPAIWASLPGRTSEVAALSLIGEEGAWRPLTTSPPRTLASLLSLAPPFLLMLGTGALSVRERGKVIGAIAVMAVVSSLFGALQLAAGATDLRLYNYTNPYVVTGFQAYRNAEADILLIGILGIAFIASRTRRDRTGRRGGSRGYWLVSGALLVTLATLMTASRGGILLLAPTLLAAWAIYSIGSQKPWRRQLFAGVAGLAVVATAGVLLVQHNSAVKAVAARFEVTKDARTDIWHDTVFAIEQYWPLGSGMGTFVPSFIAQEPLDSVDPSVPNRAHNDYLELALEAGVPGMVAFAVAALLALFLALRAWRQRPGDRSQLLFGLCALLVIAVHSLVDYPMRSMSLACIAGAAVGLFLRPWEEPVGKRAEAGPAAARRKKTAALVGMLPASALLAAYLVSATGSGLDRISRDALGMERLVPGPFRAVADRNAAAMALVRGETRRAQRLAENALRADPSDPLSASLLGTARQMMGDPSGSEAAFRVAALGGWRDRLTQLYWYGVAIDAGDIEKAALRADALLRADPQFAISGDLLHPLEESEKGREELARLLAERPSWIGEYLKLNHESDIEVLRTRALIVARVPGIGRSLGCNLPYGMTVGLLSHGLRREAVEVWRGNCPGKGPANAIADTGFEEMAASKRPSPFGWRRNSRGDIDLQIIGKADGGHAIQVRNSSSVTKMILFQAVDIAPGNYRINAAILADRRPAGGRVLMSVNCDGTPRPPVSPAGDPAIDGQRVTVGHCERPILSLWLRPSEGEITIDDVSVMPVD